MLRTLLLVTIVPAIVSDINTYFFPLYWNIAEGEHYSYKWDSIKYGILPENYTQVGSGCAVPNCKSWSQGAWPTVSKDSKGNLVPHNGGVPQAANLSHHLELIRTTLPPHVPDPNYDGNMVLDFEAWTPVWDENISPSTWHSIYVQDYSKQLVQKAHPTWSKEQVEAEAKKEWEKAAMEWFVETLKTCKSVRPKAKWGFYGRPANDANCQKQGNSIACGYDLDNTNGANLRAYAQQQLPYLKESTGLYPSIYVPERASGFPPSDTSYYVHGVVNYVVEMAKNMSNQPVYPYMWFYTHSDKHTLEPAELNAVLDVSLNVGSRGIVIWGSSHDVADPTFHTYFDEVGGPITREFMKNVTSCAMAHCSGHGRCATTTSTDCICYGGYKGPSCSQRS